MPEDTEIQGVSPQNMDTFLRALETERNSKAILYFTGERQPVQQLATQIGPDVLPLFKDILEHIPGTPVSKITLVLNTSGGHTEVPWPLVNLIREYCDTFEVLVLERALSAGTLITLGADKIIMLPYSQLSPVDPQRNSVDQNKQPKSLEIEDITGYIEFIKDKIGITEQTALAEVTKELTKEIGPTVLGSINRTHGLIRRLATNLLHLHKEKVPEGQQKEIVEHLTHKLFSHRHLINRKEAKEMVGFNDIIEYASPTLKVTADGIFTEACKVMEINEPFDPLKELGTSNEKEMDIVRAIINAIDTKYEFVSHYQLTKTPDPSGQTQIIVNDLSQQWRKQ